jgi:malonyl-CoA O-methyltransferase
MKHYNKKSNILRRNFSKSASFYDRYANIQRLAADSLLNEMPQRAIDNILELGCGTGYYTDILKRRFKGARLKAVDISREMITIAKQRIKDKQIEFMVQNAEAFESSEKFGLVTSNAVFQWFSNLEETLSSYKNLLTPNGVIIFSVFGPLTFKELRDSLNDALAKPYEKDKFSIAAIRFLAKKDLEKILRAHFSKVSIKELVIKEKYPTLTGLLRKIKYTGTRGEGLNRTFLWAPALLKRISLVYKARFGKIETSYQIFLCKAGN